MAAGCARPVRGAGGAFRRQPAPPQTRLHAVLRLRHRRLEPELADAIHGARILGSFLGAIDHGHWIRFNGLNLADSKSVTVRVASAGSGGQLEVRSASPEGPLLASFDVTPTGGWETWVEKTAPLPSTGRTDVVVRFVNPGRGGLMNLDWIQFNPATPEPALAPGTAP